MSVRKVTDTMNLRLRMRVRPQCHLFAAFLTLTLLLKMVSIGQCDEPASCMGAGDSSAVTPPLNAILYEAYFLTDDDVAQIEQRAAKSGCTVAEHAELLVWYFDRYRDSWSRDEGRNWLREVRWLVSNHPEMEIAGTQYCNIGSIRFQVIGSNSTYKLVGPLWRQQVARNGKDIKVLYNGALYFRAHDSNFAEELLDKAVRQKPGLIDPEHLGGLYASIAAYRDGSIRYRYDKITPEDRKRTARKAYSCFRLALRRATDRRSRMRLTRLTMKWAFDVGAYAQARVYAEQILKGGPGVNGADVPAYDANIVLGRLVLRAGRVRLAGRHLLAAGKSRATELWKTNTNSPDLSLARELLEKGQKRAVLSFLSDCRRFWPIEDRGTPALLAAHISRGLTPDWPTRSLLGEPVTPYRTFARTSKFILVDPGVQRLPISDNDR